MMANLEIAITRYPAARGAAWLREAFGMFSVARVPWLLLLLLYYAVMGIVELVPFVGPLAVPLLKPVFAVGFLAAAWGQERGRRPELRQLFQGFRANLHALLPLGVLFLVGIMLSVMATVLVDGGALLDMLSGKTRLDEEALASGAMQRAMLFGAVCALPVVLALWYAPALVVFHDCSAARAVALSLRASIANWRPLATYGLLVVFYGVVVPGLLIGIVGLVVPGNVGVPIAVVLMMPYFLSLVATLHISDYVSYRDIFHAQENK
jgi:hypothetical protein